jgi:hypothetical protein
MAYDMSLRPRVSMHRFDAWTNEVLTFAPQCLQTS